MSDPGALRPVRRFLATFLEREHDRAVSTLVLGAGVAQAILFATLLLLTRLFTPEDFGVLASFGGVLSVVSVLACLRFDLAIPLPETEEEAVGVLALSLLSTVVVAGLAGLAVWAAGDSLSALIGISEHAELLWLLPVGSLLLGTYNSLQYWAIRQRDFTAVSQTRVGQAAAGALTQIGMGLVTQGPFGLVLGQVINGGAGFLYLGWRAVRQARTALTAVSISLLADLGSRYRRFPLLMAPESLLGAANRYLPPVLLASLVGAGEAGVFYVAYRLLGAPVSLLAPAVGQVLLADVQRAASVEELGQSTTKLLGRLVGVAVGPLIFIGVNGPTLFSWAMGPQWLRAGVIARWLAFAACAQLLAHAVQVLLPARGHQGVALRLQGMGALLQLGTLFGVASFYGEGAAEAFAVAALAFHTIYLAVVLKTLRVSPVALAKDLRTPGMVVLSWIALATITYYASGL